jgi:hypothetical protein
VTTEAANLPVTERADKGLKSGALGLISSTVVGVASTAPAYSLAATLGLVVPPSASRHRSSPSSPTPPCYSSPSGTRR